MSEDFRDLKRCIGSNSSFNKLISSDFSHVSNRIFEAHPNLRVFSSHLHGADKN
jgi:hypothetical protein